MSKRRQSYIGEMSEPTLRVIAAALAFREKHGKDMSPGQLVGLAHAEPGAVINAALVSVLRMGFDRNVQPVKLSDRSATIVVGDPDTRRALLQLGRRRVRAAVDGVYRPW